MSRIKGHAEKLGARTQCEESVSTRRRRNVTGGLFAAAYSIKELYEALLVHNVHIIRIHELEGSKNARGFPVTIVRHFFARKFVAAK